MEPLASDPVLSTNANAGPLPGGDGPSEAVLPGTGPPPMPDPAADVVDPSPEEPPAIPEERDSA